MINTYDLTIQLVSGDKIYYNVSLTAVKHYYSHYVKYLDYRGYKIEPSIQSELRRARTKSSNWIR